jgi:hypothetical protein
MFYEKDSQKKAKQGKKFDFGLLLLSLTVIVSKHSCKMGLAMKLSISLTSTVIITISSFEYSFPEQTESQFSKVESRLKIIAQTQG